MQHSANEMNSMPVNLKSFFWTIFSIISRVHFI